MLTRDFDEETDMACRDGDARKDGDAGDGFPLMLYPGSYYGLQCSLYTTIIR